MRTFTSVVVLDTSVEACVREYDVWKSTTLQVYSLLDTPINHWQNVAISVGKWMLSFIFDDKHFVNSTHVYDVDIYIY